MATKLCGVARSIRVVRLPELPTKGDVSDWLIAGGTAEQLEQLAAREPEWQAGPASPEQPAEPDPIWTDEEAWIEADLPRRPWVAPGYALRGAVTLLSGPPSAMKSSLTLAWACAIALGRDFGRFRPTETGAVLLYNVEDDQTEQRRRLGAVLRQFNATPHDICGKVIRSGPHGVGTLLRRTDRGLIVDTEAMARLRQIIAERKPACFIADPLAELHTEEENDNTALRTVIAQFRSLAVEFNLAVVLLHHTRKGTTASPGDPDTARGASAIIGAVRIAMTLMGMREEDAAEFGMPTDPKVRSSFVRLDDAKQNYAAIREAQWFEKRAHELDNGEMVPAATPWTPPRPRSPRPRTSPPLPPPSSAAPQGESHGPRDYPRTPAPSGTSSSNTDSSQKRHKQQPWCACNSSTASKPRGSRTSTATTATASASTTGRLPSGATNPSASAMTQIRRKSAAQRSV